MHCPNCGTQNDDSATYCTNCGHEARHARGRRASFENLFIRPVLIWALLGIILAYGVLRNIPVYPFSLLAP